jgi:hypothetical protein
VFQICATTQAERRFVHRRLQLYNSGHPGRLLSRSMSVNMADCSKLLNHRNTTDFPAAWCFY